MAAFCGSGNLFLDYFAFISLYFYIARTVEKPLYFSIANFTLLFASDFTLLFYSDILLYFSIDE